jgi:hypothetical protein
VRGCPRRPRELEALLSGSGPGEHTKWELALLAIKGTFMPSRIEYKDVQV